MQGQPGAIPHLGAHIDPGTTEIVCICSPVFRHGMACEHLSRRADVLVSCPRFVKSEALIL